MPQLEPDDIQTFASIKVVGVGGAGGSGEPHERRWFERCAIYCYEHRCAGAAQ